jgi:hypothetical protein
MALESIVNMRLTWSQNPMGPTDISFPFSAVAFGPIKTRLTQAPKGEFVVRPDGTKHAVGFKGGYDEEEKW